MFSLSKFVYDGLISAIGRMEDFKIMLNAAGWHDKGVLSQDDLEAIEKALVAYNEEVKAEQEAMKKEAAKEV